MVFSVLSYTNLSPYDSKISGVCHKLALTIPTLWFQPSWIISQFEGVEKKIHLDSDAGETHLPQLS